MHGHSLFALLLMLIGGCTADSSREGASGLEASGNHSPIIHEATIYPSPIVLVGPISVQIHADDLDRDALAFHHRWFVNGVALEDQTAPTLSPSFLKKGDSVTAEIIPDDGKTRGALYRTAAVTVGNTPPIISSLLLRPQPAKPGDKVEALIEAHDPDRDNFDALFRWWRNGTVTKEGEEAVLDTSGFSTKDVVTVEVTLRDRTSIARPVRSEPLVLGNGPPTILSTPPIPTRRERYEYAVRTTDPEGDHIRYRLETAPPGMTIETETGHIAWQVGSGSTGTHKIRVVAEDTHGGTAFQEFDMTVPDAIP